MKTREDVFIQAVDSYGPGHRIIWDSPNQDKFPNVGKDGMFNFGIVHPDHAGVHVTTWGPTCIFAGHTIVGQILSSYCCYAD